MGEVGYKTLAIDIETFSDVDLIKCGVYAYADSPAFEILLFAYSFDDEETKIIDLAQGEQLTEEIKNALSDVGIIKTAFNANFERTCLSKYMGVRLSPESWVCTAVQSAMLALPLSLEGVGAVLGLSEQKLKEGKDLIRYFCVPCKPTKTNGGRSRNLPFHAPEKWKQFKTYCIRDVDVEKGIRQKLHKFPIPESEMAFYRLDQEINDRGVLVDRELVEQSITCDLLHKDIVTNRAYEVTGLENPNSVSQLKGWLSERGVEIDSLSKGAVAELIEDADGEVLELLNAFDIVRIHKFGEQDDKAEEGTDSGKLPSFKAMSDFAVSDEQVKSRGGMAVKFVSPGFDGVPDRLVLLPGGKCAFVELKAPGKKLRPLKEKRKHQLEALGFSVYVIDGLEQIGGVLHGIQTT